MLRHPEPMSAGITEPEPRLLQTLLRRAVLEHAGSERRRVFPAVLHVGTPGGTSTSFEITADEPTDHALRVDVVEAMLRRVRRRAVDSTLTLAWLTRPGRLDPQDVDLWWLAAVRSAAAELDLALPMVVVNRTSWRDPATGATREWRRLRER